MRFLHSKRSRFPEYAAVRHHEQLPAGRWLRAEKGNGARFLRRVLANLCFSRQVFCGSGSVNKVAGRCKCISQQQGTQDKPLGPRKAGRDSTLSAHPNASTVYLAGRLHKVCIDLEQRNRRGGDLARIVVGVARDTCGSPQWQPA